MYDTLTSFAVEGYARDMDKVLWCLEEGEMLPQESGRETTFDISLEGNLQGEKIRDEYFRDRVRSRWF